MHPLQWEYRPDGLRAPALVCAFKGWNDAADAASTALTFVAGTLGAQRFATIDPEEFYDFQATRPQRQAGGRRDPGDRVAGRSSCSRPGSLAPRAT